MIPISTSGLTKYYGETRGVEDLTLRVENGEIFGYLGPNGAGKTTTIRTLLGFLSPTRGTATVLGAAVSDREALRRARKRIGYVPGELGFDESVTGARLLDYHEQLKGGPRRVELTDLFEPPLSRTIGEYSRGNKQKLALVQAFMHDPDLVVMDEPTSGLDPLLQERFYEFLREEQAAGTTVFFSSHVLTEVRKVCDRVAILRDGHLVELTPVADLLGRSGRVVTVRFEAPVETVPFDAVHDLTHTADGRQVSFTYTGEYDPLVQWLADRSVLDLEIEEPPLESVFMHFYDADEHQANAMAESTAAANVSGDDDA